MDDLSTGRLALHGKLAKYYDKLYFQPPSDVRLSYPCIVYTKMALSNLKANDGNYISRIGYQITVIENDPDSNVAFEMIRDNPTWVWSSHFVQDNLNHTIIVTT